jgi:Amt family ammonium transporter
MEKNGVRTSQGESTTDTIQFIMPEPLAVADDRYRRPHYEKKGQRRGMHVEDVPHDIEKPLELVELRPGVARVSIIA